MPHRRRANEVSLCYLQSGGTCTGRSKLENLHRQEDSLEPAPAGRTMNQTYFDFQTQFDFAFGMKEKKFDRYFDHAIGELLARVFPTDIFTVQISRSVVRFLCPDCWISLNRSLIFRLRSSNF